MDASTIGVRAGIEALTYAGVVALLLTGASILLGIAIGVGLAGGNMILFVLGWVLLAYATFRMWPRSPDDLEAEPREDRASIPGHRNVRGIEGVIQRLPPNRWVTNPPVDRRWTIASKLFLASVLTLAISFTLETVFGIG